MYIYMTHATCIIFSTQYVGKYALHIHLNALKSTRAGMHTHTHLCTYTHTYARTHLHKHFFLFLVHAHCAIFYLLLRQKRVIPDPLLLLV